MIESICLVLLLIALLLISYQDIKQRKIHVALPFIVFFAALIMTFSADSFIATDLMYTIGFIVLNMIVLTLYFSVKHNSLVNPMKEYIGLGDILFFIAITPLFAIRSYIVFFIGGMIFSLVIYFLFNKTSHDKSIPLAGYLSIFLMLFMFVDNLVLIDLFKNPII